MRDNNIYFDYNSKDDDDSFDISSYSGKRQEYEDIVSDSRRTVRGSSGKHSNSKKSSKSFFNKFNKWWHGLSKTAKGLLITVLVLFVILCLFVIWTVLPFQMRGRLFLSAFGLMALNLFVYFGIRWKKRGLQSAITSSFSVILSAVMVVTLFFWIPFLQLIYNFDDSFSSSAEDLAAVPKIDKDITNIALFGIDTRDVDSFSGNSDSIMIMSLNAKTHKVKIFSVMRDSLVPITKNGKTSYSKINSAYQKGDAQLAVHTLNTVFDLDITEYATVNFFGMAQIIDGVGGIEVTLTEGEVKKAKANHPGFNECLNEICAELGLNPEDYYIKTAGTHHVNGVQAVAYSRIRYVANVWGTNNDFGRTDRQRYVMEQLFNKALTLKKTEYPGLIKALIPYTKTSLSPDEILSFALTILSGTPTFEQARIPHDDFIMTAPGGSFGSVVYYDLDLAADAIHAMIYDDVTIDEFIEQHPDLEPNDWYSSRYSSSSGSSSKNSSGSSGGGGASSSSRNEVTSSDSSQSESSEPEITSSEEPTDSGSSSSEEEQSSSESSSSSDESSGSSDTSGSTSSEAPNVSEPSEPSGSTSTEVETGTTP